MVGPVLVHPRAVRAVRYLTGPFHVRTPARRFAMRLCEFRKIEFERDLGEDKAGRKTRLTNDVVVVECKPVPGVLDHFAMHGRLPRFRLNQYEREVGMYFSFCISVR